MKTRHFFRVLASRGFCYRLVSLGLTVVLLGLAQTTGVDVVSADTDVCGPITSDTVWTPAGNPYIVTCDVQVASGVTLTVESTVIVKFDADTSLQVDGTLVAGGATFTSNGSAPAIGDWGHILFTAASTDGVLDESDNYVSGSVIQNCLLEWGGGSEGVEGMVEVGSASPFIDHNTIRNSETRGIHALGRSAAQPIVIKGNSVSGSGGGMYVSAARVIGNVIDGNTSWCDDNGGGILASDSDIISNTVSGNSTPCRANGGGIYASGCDLTGNVVNGSYANGSGGGIYAGGCDMTGNTVNGNRTYAGGGGGIYMVGGTLSGNDVGGNTAYEYGGGVFAQGGTIAGNTVSGNRLHPTRAGARGGGIYGSGSTISGNTVASNAVDGGDDEIGQGGGIYADGGSVSGNTVSDNSVSGLDSLGGGVYGDLATVESNTITSNSANRGGAVYAEGGMVSLNTILSNTATLSGTLYVEQGIAVQNTLRGNTALAGGGLYGDNGTLTGNTVEGNTAFFGGGIYAEGGTVNANTVMNNTAQSNGGGIYARGGVVTHNTVSRNSVLVGGHGSGVHLSGIVDFGYNTVTTNTTTPGTVGTSAGGVSISGQPEMSYNNLYGNQPFDAEVVSSDDVTATLNYWGPSACTAIAGQVYDGSDAPGRGHLSYGPSLYTPAPLAQLSAPTALSVLTSTWAVTLTWMEIPALPQAGCRPPGVTSADVGYRVYYDSDDPCPPYTGSGLDQGSSPIDVGDVTTVTLTGMSKRALYFTITAYDYLDRESAHSNDIVAMSSDKEALYLPLVLRNR